MTFRLLLTSLVENECSLLKDAISTKERYHLEKLSFNLCDTLDRLGKIDKKPNVKDVCKALHLFHLSTAQLLVNLCPDEERNTKEQTNIPSFDDWISNDSQLNKENETTKTNSTNTFSKADDFLSEEKTNSTTSPIISDIDDFLGPTPNPSVNRTANEENTHSFDEKSKRPNIDLFDSIIGINESLNNGKEEVEEEEESNSVEVPTNEVIQKWANGKNIRTLLATLHLVVLWDHSLEPCSVLDIISESNVRKRYLAACLLVHPDKIKAHSKTRKLIEPAAISIFSTLRAAYESFRNEAK